MLKSIGTAARIDIEKLLNTKVFLGAGFTYVAFWWCGVKVKKNWRNDKQLLKELGYK
ncbi:MAG: hypothetical protein QMC83_08265 [Thermodesulfovibrionales bacterium]|nr:hypothetical protein [Thermodesulfovibrionales bacterium]